MFQGGKNMRISNNTFNYSNTSNFTSTKKWKKVYDEHLSNLISEEAIMTPEQKMLYELLGGREAHMKNVMHNYDADGDLLNSDGVAGMDATDIPESERHQIIKVSENARQNMYEETMRHYIQENGVANGDTTKRSEVYRDYQLSIKKEDRLKGTWSLQQYETAYRQSFYDAIKKADPKWEIGKPFDSSILKSLSREDIDNSLVQSGDRLLLPRKTVDCRV